MSDDEVMSASSSDAGIYDDDDASMLDGQCFISVLLLAMFQ